MIASRVGKAVNTSLASRTSVTPLASSARSISASTDFMPASLPSRISVEPGKSISWSSSFGLKQKINCRSPLKNRCDAASIAYSRASAAAEIFCGPSPDEPGRSLSCSHCFTLLALMPEIIRRSSVSSPEKRTAGFAALAALVVSGPKGLSQMSSCGAFSGSAAR